MGRFRYPDGNRRSFTIEKRTEFIPVGDKYRVAIELIQFDGRPEKHIRFAYWRKATNKDGNEYWGWASQTTWTFSVDVTKQAIKMAEQMGFFDS